MVNIELTPALPVVPGLVLLGRAVAALGRDVVRRPVVGRGAAMGLRRARGVDPFVLVGPRMAGAGRRPGLPARDADPSGRAHVA